MSFTRRLIALVLLLALAPSLVLAAMPVKYCASSAGHQSLEVVIGSIAHGGHDASHRDLIDELTNLDDCGLTLSHAEEQGCRDSELVNLAPAPSMTQLDLPELSVARIVAPEFSHLGARHSLSITFRRFSPDPRLTARRTTVLRI